MPDNRLRRLAPALIAAMVMTACGGDDPSPSAARFCAEVAANRTSIVSPTLTGDIDVDVIVELHQRLSALAPLAVATEWGLITEAVQAAAAVDASDADSVQRAVDAAYRSEAAAVTVAEWVLASCGVDLGPVTTIVPHDRPEPAAPVGS